MRFTLTMLLALIALAAIEIATLKSPTYVGAALLEFFLCLGVLIATWGAFCLRGNSQRFCLGFAVVVWATFFFSLFELLVDNPLRSDYLMQYVGQFLGHKRQDDHVLYESHWKLWSYINFGLLGGVSALCFNAAVAESSVPQQSKDNV